MAGWLGEKLSELSLNLVKGGLVGFSGVIEDEGEEFYEELLSKTEAIVSLPPEMRAILKDLTKKPQTPGALQMVLMVVFAAISLAGVVGALQPATRRGSHYAEKLLHSYRLDPATIKALWLRGFPDEIRKEEWWEDLREQGWSEERINAEKELAMLLPSPSDLISWQAREVFEPEMVKKYGLDDEFELLDLTLFEKVGISPEMAKNFWRAHWVHANWMQMVEMRRRGQVTDADLWDWFRLVEIPPFWREKLMALVWEVPTRVDVRRWWDMRTIDETELRDIYHRQGYAGKDLDNYVLWTKVFVLFPDLIDRYKKGWISLDEVRAGLLEVGMLEERVTILLETKFKKPQQQERIAKERDLTKSEIIKGVKKEILTVGQGITMLVDMGYDGAEADYIIAINVAAAGSPETPLEFREIIEKYKRAMGMEGKEIPEEIKTVEKEFLRLTRELKEAIAKGEEQEIIDRLTTERVIMEFRLSELMGLFNL